MQLALHIGAHRTGSTAFQRILAQNAAALAREGTLVWGPDELRPRPHFYLPETEDFEPGSGEAFARDLDGVTADRLVISEENMLGNMRVNLVERDFYPDALRRMTAYRALIGHEPARIGLGIRGYASYWTSAYLYSLPRHRLPQFDQLKPRILSLQRGWLDVLRELRGLFPAAEIMVWPLESVDQKMKAMVARFLDMPADRLANLPRRINASRGLAIVDRIHALRAERPDITPAEIEQALAEAPPPDGGAAPLFSDEEMLALSLRYSGDLSALEEGFENVTFVTRPARGRP